MLDTVSAPQQVDAMVPATLCWRRQTDASRWDRGRGASVIDRFMAFFGTRSDSGRRPISFRSNEADGQLNDELGGVLRAKFFW